MALHLGTSVTQLPGIGAKAAADLRVLGIVSVRDLLMYFPFRYEDYSEIKPLATLQHGETVTVHVRIRTISTRPARNRGKLKLTEAIVEDDSGTAKVTWFNQPYLERKLKAGVQVALAGRVDTRYGLGFTSPVQEPVGKRVHTGRIVPVYGLTGSLTMNRLRSAIKAALSAAEEYEEWLPDQVLEAEKFSSVAEAVKSIHFPESRDDLGQAISRFKFEELFLHQLLFAEVREQRKGKVAHAIPEDVDFLKQFVTRLPFTPTYAQKRAVWEIVQDCALDRPMNRLLEGDVGSGKTVVAAMAIANVLRRDLGAAYLAPTEILAVQQQAALVQMITEGQIGLLTGSHAKIGNDDISRTELLESLEKGEIACLVGTHALFQEGVKVSNLGLVVIDEQHRFGVQQRHALLETGEDPAPHLLSMTATPIPRSLFLGLYGDLDLSVLDEMPAGRQTITTTLVDQRDQAQMWQHVQQEIDSGHQVYVVCPLIDPSDKLGSRSVMETARGLKKRELKGARVEVLHGKMKPDEKTKVIKDFRDGNISVVVSTTVVEVGVDVPQATVMVILGAERFGLAQLHQLRGRVGRSHLASFCYLVPDELGQRSRERLQAMVTCSDGFQLAEKDLELRGAGNVFGNAQSGFPDFKLATPADIDLMKKARDWATRLLEDDPELSAYPQLQEHIERSLDEVHME